jgi:hypothetical protein
MYQHNEAATVLAATANDFFPVSAYLGHCDVDVFQEGKDKGLFYLTDATQMDRFVADAKLVQPNGESPAALKKKSLVGIHKRAEAMASAQRSLWSQKEYDTSGTSKSGRRVATATAT